MQKIIFAEKILGECVREMQRGYQQGSAMLVRNTITGEAGVVVEASSQWSFGRDSEWEQVMEISDTDGHGGYVRGALGEEPIDLSGHLDILHVWESQYDDVLAAARAIIAERSEGEQEEISTVRDIPDALDQTEIDRLVKECEGMWFTIEDLSGDMIDILFDDLRDQGYDPEIKEVAP